MVGEMLSQEEINALLGGGDFDSASGVNESYHLTPEQVDALGEIGNISMGTAATTLFSLLNHKVLITTPRVDILSLEEFKSKITDTHIAVSVGYTVGLVGTNLLILDERDVKIITDLMMGGSGVATDEPLSELHLSAISEAMNQMIGSSSTSLSQIFDKKIDISTPQAMQISGAAEHLEKILGSSDPIAKVSFRLQIEENIIDTELMQIIPIDFARDLISNLLKSTEEQMNKTEETVPTQAAQVQQQPIQQQPMQQQPIQQQPMQQQPQMQQQMYAPSPEQNQVYQGGNPYPERQAVRDVDVQKAQFPQFDQGHTSYPKENMNVLLDVSLEVSVELGRTKKRIREILELGPGSVIELDRLVGEPIDILVNGKFIAKGEVVAIDENFGVRITDIINPENRI